MTPRPLAGHTLPTSDCEASAREFVRVLLARAEAFRARCEMRSIRATLADRPVAVEVPVSSREDGIDVSQAFIKVSPMDSDAPLFSLTVIDDRFGSELPIGRWPSTAHAPWGTLRPDRTAPVRVALDRHTQTVSAFDTRTGRAVVWMRRLADLPYWAAATPFRLTLSWMADTFGAEFVHGAVIGDGERAVLAVGPSGAGKSTSGLLQLAQGFQVAVDDYVVLCNGVLYPVYTRAKLHDASIPIIRDTVGPLMIVNENIGGQKRIVDLCSLNRGGVLRSMSLKAVVETRQGSSAGMALITSGRALASMAPYSISGLLGGNILSLGRMARECSGVPTMAWTVQRQPNRDAEAFSQVWERALAS